MSTLPKVIFFVFAISVCKAALDPVVQLPKGKILGHVLKSENGSDYYAFQEIPYAAPPVGSNRFKPPKEPDAWNGTLNTTRNTVVCYQNVVKYANLNISEDCLYVNVYTPVQPGSNASLLPVLVWIHGGGYTAESSTYEYYGPKYIMDHGVVVVTFNYRLGPFGFLTTEDDVIPGNLGLKDQRFAMKWVHDNIGLFGGNNSHVVLVGESAGSGSVGLHLTGPVSDGQVLFHAAIMQSGSAVWTVLTNYGRESAFAVGKALGSDTDNSTELLKILQQASAGNILRANISGNWSPILETDGDFSYPMLESYMTGNFKQIPVLIGINSEEWLYFASYANVREQADSFDKDPSLMISTLINVTDRKAVGEQLKRIYTNTSFGEDIGAYIRYSSDNDFSTPSLKQAELQSKYADIYFYQFSYKGELGMQMQLPHLPDAGLVAHAEDLKYMWDDQTNSDLSKFPEADRLMLHRYVKLWTNFVKYYNPTPEADPLLQNITWPTLDPKKLDEIPYLNMNVTFDVRTNPRQYQQVKKLLDQNILPPYICY